MRLAKEAGFDGIELAMEETGELKPGSGMKEINALKQAAEDIGIDLVSLNSSLYWTYSFTSSRLENRKQAFQVAQKHIELAACLGIDTVAIMPGMVGADFLPDQENAPYDAAYHYALEGIGRLAEIAEQHRVHIGLKNVWNKFLLSPLEFRTFIDTISSEYVGSYFDVGNVLATGYPEQWIPILNNRIRKVHFKDYRRQTNSIHGFVDLLAGDVNYPVVMEQLHNVSYDGYVTAEVPSYARYPEQAIYNASRAIDAIVGNKASQQ
ncbi:sugar phosphate isomerase/epimerase family protein [Paenibacillus contaminans]|uniref:Sugar phosphate isomerase/epimerase n=1 Tax=Paenibacillus contaminans TaxID=450362 RepID=A0A329MP58_9BACL|nr:sugar phosphate isomerase/epimerase family protein [Paenibacillus contaminans]RAV21665.1 sugar phosphate isomerase/epimerase [Paenibacillus contaminans]